MRMQSIIIIGIPKKCIKTMRMKRDTKGYECFTSLFHFNIPLIYKISPH